MSKKNEKVEKKIETKEIKKVETKKTSTFKKKKKVKTCKLNVNRAFNSQYILTCSFKLFQLNSNKY